VNTTESTRQAALSGPPELEGPRACLPHELASYIDLANLVFRVLNTAPGMPVRWPNVGFEWGHVYEPSNLNNIRVVSSRGQVVSALAIYPTVVHTPRGKLTVGGINCFCTHPDFRRLGLGEQILEDSLEHMRAMGCHISLLETRVQDYYRKFGWESAGRQRSFVFDRGNADLLQEATGLELNRDWQSQLAALQLLHRRRPIVAERSREILAILAQRKVNNLWIGRRHGEVVGYAAVSGTTVVEYAGAVPDVLALLRHSFRQLDATAQSTTERAPGRRATPEMKLVTPGPGDPVADALDNLGIPYAHEYVGMIAILDVARLFEALGMNDIQAEARTNGLELRSRGQACTVGQRELVKLVFGPERRSDFRRDVFPIPFFQWPLDRV
jgi:ribosomal protein S18 acetylase RimI-like enzyme